MWGFVRRAPVGLVHDRGTLNAAARSGWTVGAIQPVLTAWRPQRGQLPCSTAKQREAARELSPARRVAQATRLGARCRGQGGCRDGRAGLTLSGSSQRLRGCLAPRLAAPLALSAAADCGPHQKNRRATGLALAAAVVGLRSGWAAGAGSGRAAAEAAVSRPAAGGPGRVAYDDRRSCPIWSTSSSRPLSFDSF
eukprot:COSAG04_NODE_9297_length_876_cov_1.992278_1_plen_194_part_00